MIRGIIFDCFGVLYGGSLTTLLALCPTEHLDELRDLNKQSDYGLMSGDDYIAGVAELLGKSRQEVEWILQEKHVRNQPLIDFCQSLRSEYKVGMLSNVSSGTMDYLFPPEQREQLFDAVILSYEVSIVKPNPEIFVMMAEQLGLMPGECVMIDDLESNCEGAEIAGMQSIQHINNDLTHLTLAKLLA